MQYIIIIILPLEYSSGGHYMVAAVASSLISIHLCSNDGPTTDQNAVVLVLLKSRCYVILRYTYTNIAVAGH